ncbi:MAG: hypothetical protein U1F67_21750 [Rubrivivax sp.]
MRGPAALLSMLPTAWVLGLVTTLAGYATPASAAPVIEKAVKGERCVEDVASMRRNHMRFLGHQRDDTVRGGIRGAKHSLKGCVDRHASRTSSVAAQPGDFCVACHLYVAVKIDCFDCYATRPAPATAAAAAQRCTSGSRQPRAGGAEVSAGRQGPARFSAWPPRRAWAA